MKICVISDTHTDSIDNLPQQVLDELSGADMIIHAGDFTGRSLVDALRKMRPFRGVYGNIDGPDVRRELPAVALVEVEGLKIGVNHPAEGGSPLTLEQRLRPKFTGVQAIIHGHSHRTKNDYRDGILWFNPGSATGRLPATKKTYGILTINKEIRGEIITI
ncbi:MAG TPA: metallophosphoesterase family protein [Candidatus Bathyarchaeia archaeon]|nr:metallophosphoesterase family protein [Candidatus Bathyarchaeia archaeon]